MFPSLVYCSGFCYKFVNKLNCFCPRDSSQICGCGNLFLSHTTLHFKNSSAGRSQHAIAVLSYAANFPWREAVENPNWGFFFNGLFSCHFFRELHFSVKLSINILNQEAGGGGERGVGNGKFSSVAQLCPTLRAAMDCSTPAFPVHHQLLEFT